MTTPDEQEMKKRVLKLLLQGKMPTQEELDKAVVEQLKAQSQNNPSKQNESE
jgi:membrane peptidoglycan carboxypeptidase